MGARIMRDKDHSDNLAYQAFAARLRSAVERSGLSQSQIADLANITEVSMSRYMAGSRVPHPIILARLCTAVGCDADWLIGRTETAHAYKFDDVIKALEYTQTQINKVTDFGRGVNEGINYAIHTLEVMK